MPEEPLQQLFDEAEPPAELRERVLRSVVPARQRWRRAAAGGALAAGLLLAFVAGRASRAEASAAPQYLLLLYEGAGYRDDRPVNAIVGEYRRWADSLRSKDLLADAGKLEENRLTLDRRGRLAAEATSVDPTGYFIIRAGQLAEAEAIARTSPHLRYGGVVVLRRVQ